MAEKAILYDPSKCTACRGCQVACKQWWGLEGEKTTNRGTYENPPDLSYNTWVKIRFNEVESKKTGGVDWVFSRQSCMHCTDAACVHVCPSGALYHHPSGAVAFNEDLCTGCGYCVEFCPFNVPRARGTSATVIRKINKCIMCLDRISNGLEPSCVKTCPSGALQFGDRQEMVALGKQRVQEIKSTYPDAYLYGENELGGLHLLFVLMYPPEVHGLPAQPDVPVAAVAADNIIRPVGYALAGIVAVGLGLNYIVSRATIKKDK
jgi:formate dehydrogenase iron-sulfur subunit